MLAEASSKGKPVYFHAVDTPANQELLNRYDATLLFIYRDPRDHAVSAAHFIKKYPSNGDNTRRVGVDPRYARLPLKNLLAEIIRNRTEFYRLFTPWMKNPRTYSVRFENLIGDEGGGSTEIQIREIMEVAKHIGVPITKERAAQIGKALFGGTSTFRKGQIGAWKKEFTEEHKALFKKRCGQLLIDLGYENDFDW